MELKDWRGLKSFFVPPRHNCWGFSGGASNLEVGLTKNTVTSLHFRKLLASHRRLAKISENSYCRFKTSVSSSKAEVLTRWKFKEYTKLQFRVENIRFWVKFPLMRSLRKPRSLGGGNLSPIDMRKDNFLKTLISRLYLWESLLFSNYQ